MYRSQIELGVMAIDHVLYPTKKKEESICFHVGDLLYFSSILQPHCPTLTLTQTQQRLPL